MIFARKAAKLTIAKVASITGYSPSLIQKYEHGKIASPNVTVVEELANVYGVNPGWLLGWDVPRVMPKEQSFLSFMHFAAPYLSGEQQDLIIAITKEFNKRKAKEYDREIWHSAPAVPSEVQQMADESNKTRFP